MRRRQDPRTGVHPHAYLQAQLFFKLAHYCPLWRFALINLATCATFSSSIARPASAPQFLLVLASKAWGLTWQFPQAFVRLPLRTLHDEQARQLVTLCLGPLIELQACCWHTWASSTVLLPPSNSGRLIKAAPTTRSSLPAEQEQTGVSGFSTSCCACHSATSPQPRYLVSSFCKFTCIWLLGPLPVPSICTQMNLQVCALAWFTWGYCLWSRGSSFHLVAP